MPGILDADGDGGEREPCDTESREKPVSKATSWPVVSLPAAPRVFLSA